MKLGVHIDIDPDSGIAVCAECEESLGSIGENLKQSLVVNERPIADSGPYYDDPDRFVSEEMVFREYYCPGCGTRHFVSSAKPDDEHLSEVEIDPETL